VYVTYAVKVILTLSYRDVNTNAECLNYEGRLFLSLTTLKYRKFSKCFHIVTWLRWKYWSSCL